MKQPAATCQKTHPAGFPLRLVRLVLLVAMAEVCTSAMAGSGPPSMLDGALVATDRIGRTLPSHEQVGPPKADKWVACFYWTWHGHFSASHEPHNITEITKKYPEAIGDPSHPAWGPEAAPHHWGEPLFGYYSTADRWVLRKHAEMLADAGVDAVFFDCTNGALTWEESLWPLCEVWDQARRDGVQVPKIAFMMAFGETPGSREALTGLYERLYKPGRYRDLWFEWDGKPLVMAYPKHMPEEIQNFFTFRPGQPVYDKGPQRPDHWGWLEVFPQHGFGKKPNGTFEQATVGVAQNWVVGRGLSPFTLIDSCGRSFHNGRQDTSPGAILRGYNFQEQWDRALEIDPDLVFITGWNEWVAGKYSKGTPFWGIDPVNFVDQFSAEKSRDCEPSKGILKDNYYLQMTANIRRFKGLPPPPRVSEPCAVLIDGAFEDWVSVSPEYRDHKGIVQRDNAGWKGTHYMDSSGRNDVVAMKVARDREHLFFHTKTDARLSPASDPGWMLLFLDTDRNKSTGWEGYDYLVNRSVVNGKTSLEKYLPNDIWKKVDECPIQTVGDQLELSIPRRTIGLSAAPLNFEFKWVDNPKEPFDIMDFYVSGDAAPNGRFNYVFSEIPQ